MEKIISSNIKISGGFPPIFKRTKEDNIKISTKHYQETKPVLNIKKIMDNITKKTIDI